MAESKSGVKGDSSSKAGTREAGAALKAPLADMEPAPDTTMPAPQPVAAVMDCSTWPGLAGRGSVSVPASPTIQPSSTPPSSVSSMSDGRLSPTKGDSRADRFRLEQRKLLSAIKSDPKLGIAGEEEEEQPDVENSADAASAGLSQDSKTEGEHSSLGEGVQRLSKSGLTAELDPAGQQARSGADVVDVAIQEGKDGKEDVPQAQKSGISVGASEDKGEAKGRKAERSDSGSKLQATTDAAPARSGIRLGAASSLKTDLSTHRSCVLSAASKYSAVSASKTRPTTTSTGQRRTNITGLNGSSSSSSSPTTTAPSRSVLSRYPPASATSSSVSRRPIASHPPSSTALSRSSSGSLTGSPRRPASSTGSPVRHSFESSLRTYSGSSVTAPLTSLASDTSLASASSAARGRRVSGDKSVSSSRDSTSVSQGRVGGSVFMTKPSSGVGNRAAAGSSRFTAVSGGASSKTASGTGAVAKTVSSLPGTNSASKSSTNISGLGVTTKLIPSASSASGVGAATKVSGGAPSGVGATGSASPRKLYEKCPDQKSTEASGQPPSGAKDLSSDRTPRFV